MNILHVSAPATTGGLETVIRLLSRGQQAAGATVAVAAVLDTDPGSHPFMTALRADGVATRPLVLPPRAYRDEWRGLREVIRASGAQVVHTHGARSDVIGGWAARAEGVPWVSTAHGFTGGDFRNRCYEWLQMRFLRRAGAVAAVAESVKHRLVRSGISASRVRMIRNAWSAPGAIEPRDSARKRLGLKSDGLVLGWVGRITHEKGLDVLLDALPAAGSSATLAVIGVGADRAGLEEKGRQAGLPIQWCGEVPDAGTWFRAFDLLLLSSRTEGTPMVLFEAMAAGVPIVATRVGGVPDVLDDHSAWLVAPEDPPALAATIREALADPAERSRRAERAGRRVGEQFGMAAWVSAYQSLYQELVGERRHG